MASKNTRKTLEEAIAQGTGVCKWCMEGKCWTHGQIQKPEKPAKKQWQGTIPVIKKTKQDNPNRKTLDEKIAETGGVCKWCMEGACWSHGQVEKPPPKPEKKWAGNKWGGGAGGGGGMANPGKAQMIAMAQQLMAAATGGTGGCGGGFNAGGWGGGKGGSQGKGSPCNKPGCKWCAMGQCWGSKR
eukprot:TRINITY_DN0_c0_g1_i1.p2 TRINITY_DN0_c0_g1~~TRINITY_DN0_c0_g1_i1.p2  ORF type:complete len:185 (-),score=38.11 TRINITY_DN0_c0_g1_i1:185-739(-)